MQNNNKSVNVDSHEDCDHPLNMNNMSAIYSEDIFEFDLYPSGIWANAFEFELAEAFSRLGDFHIPYSPANEDLDDYIFP